MGLHRGYPLLADTFGWETSVVDSTYLSRRTVRTDPNTLDL